MKSPEPVNLIAGTISVYYDNIHLKMAKLPKDCEGFNWDEGNSNKNWHLHGVTDGECEEVFFNLPLVVVSDRAHSGSEPRFLALGITEAKRRLFVSFTIRKNLIRIISSRDMTKREDRRYEEKVKRDSGI